MALTPFQREICRLLAQNRAPQSGYVAGGAALNTLLQGARLSEEVDVFHDTEEAVVISWENDRSLLAQNDYEVELLRQFPTFVEARIARGEDGVVMKWAYDSAFRFFHLSNTLI